MAFDRVCGRVNSPNFLSVVDLITPRYPTRSTEFLRIDFHRTNYGIQEPLSSAMRQFRSAPGLVFESSEADFVDLSNSSPIFREHCALPCCCALSFSTVKMLSGRFCSPHHLIFVTRFSRYFLIFFFMYMNLVLSKGLIFSVRLKSVDNK
jgi:hypothetical protein